MAMNFLPGSVTVAPYRDDQRRLAVADPLRTYITAMSSLVAYWPLDDTSGSYSHVINPALAEGRNLIVDPGFNDASKWTAQANWSVAAGVASAAAVTVAQFIFPATGILTVGKFYTVTYDVVVTSGIILFQCGSGTNSTPRSASGTYTETLLCAGNGTLGFRASSGTFTGTIDNVSVTEVGIPASSAFPTLEMVKNGGFDWDVCWTKGAGWTITGGVAVATAVGVAVALSHATGVALIVGRQYDITYTLLNYSAGSMRVKCGDGGAGTTRSANGTYTETLTCTTNTNFKFEGITTFTGQIDNVSVVPHDGLIVQNGDGSTTTGWTAANSATLSSVSSWLRVAYNAVANAGATQNSLKIGSTYHLTGSMRGDGTAIPQILNASPLVTGTGSGSTQAVDLIFVATGIQIVLRNTTSSGYVEFRNVVVTELPPMIGTLVNGLLINQTSGNSLLDPVTTWDAVNDADNIYSGSLNSALPINEWTLIAFAKVSSAGVWSDGVNRRIVGFSAVDGLNFFVLNKGTTTNNLQFQIDLASTSKTVNDSTRVGATTDWFMVAMTGSKAADQFIAYLNGVPTGSIQTGLGQWVGNLLNSVAVIGASSNAGTAPWSGSIAHVALFNAPLAPDVLMLIAQLGGVA